MSLPALELDDHGAPIRLRVFHGQCGAGLYNGWRRGERIPRYYATTAANAAELDLCPACGEELIIRVARAFNPGTCDVWHGDVELKTTVLTAYAMEQRYLAARERLCAGAPVDAEAIVCMGAELDDLHGLTLEDLAPLYGRTPEQLRAEIAAFTATSTTQPPNIHEMPV